MENDDKAIVGNIIKIRTNLNKKQAEVAQGIEIDYSTYSKIESGQIKLSVERLAQIASYFGMSIIDVISYPEKLVSLDTLSDCERIKRSPKVTLSIELEDNIKADVIKLAFGDRVLEITNK